MMPGFLAVFSNVTILILFSLCVAMPSSASSRINCDIQQDSCEQTMVDGSRIEFDILPKPVTAMTELNFIVTITQNGKPARDTSASLDLSMPGMFMGKNRPVLEKAGEGRWRGKGVLVRCASGRKLWQAEVSVQRAGTSTKADFVFEVK